MKVSLATAPSFEAVKAPGTQIKGAPLLDENGPKTILSWQENAFAISIQPDEKTMFGPRGVCLHPNGSLWVADTGHHRLLGWHKCPDKDNAAADIMIGQPNFNHEGRNGKTDPSDSTMNVPTGICAWGDGLALADAWNHRILLWKTVPTKSNQPADIILGQQNGTDVLANEDMDKPNASTMHWPYGVAFINNKLIVCDTGNRRMLIWNDPTTTGQNADLVIGQNDFETRDENAGAEINQMSMRWPHQITYWNDHLAVADAGNNRIMLWKGMPSKNGQACDLLLGQSEFTKCDHNMSNYYPTNQAVNMPYALATLGERLICGDTANSRLIGWSDCQMGANADTLTAQPDFASKGDNKWGVATRDSICWPYGISVLGNTVAIADSGNNRILIWDAAL